MQTRVTLKDLPKGMNKTEAKWRLKLLVRKDPRTGDIYWFDYEPWSLKIGDGAWYKPDFIVVTLMGKIEAHEVKGGFIREAARVRFKAASKQYPFIDFQMWQKKKDVWKRIL